MGRELRRTLFNRLLPSSELYGNEQRQGLNIGGMGGGVDAAVLGDRAGLFSFLSPTEEVWNKESKDINNCFF